ncbi:hypothetical protein QE152_g40468 [Popillia japonica]|uniref:Uncharacterized protein n=1 Tax=Popillia japonica TaxID=7064 RepID=A0AAW1HGE3_POPJA
MQIALKTANNWSNQGMLSINGTNGDASRGVAADLAYIDTRTMVSGYYENDTDKAIRRAEIIVILPDSKHETAVSPPEEKFRQEYERLIKLTRMCTMFAPKSILYICVPPISMSVPLVSAVFRKTHWYHPGRIIGSVDFHQVRLNSLVAFHNDLDPSGVHVPVIGGPDIDTLIPLFSRATPVGLGPHEALCLTRRFRNLADCDDVMKEKKNLEYYDLSPLSHAHSLHRAITTIALGLLGDQQADICGFIDLSPLSHAHSLHRAITTIALGLLGDQRLSLMLTVCIVLSPLLLWGYWEINRLISADLLGVI